MKQQTAPFFLFKGYEERRTDVMPVGNIYNIPIRKPNHFYYFFLRPMLHKTASWAAVGEQQGLRDRNPRAVNKILKQFFKSKVQK